MSMSQAIYKKGDFCLNKHESWGSVKSSIRSLSDVPTHLFKLKHPFIMVGDAAAFAMNVKWEDPTTVDLLVRASTLEKLKTVLAITDSWTEINSKTCTKSGSQWIEQRRRNACSLLKRNVPRGGHRCKYLRLWTEEDYGLKINFDFFIQIKPTFQLFEKAEPEDPSDEKSIIRYIPETYVPTLPALVEATVYSIYQGRRGRAYNYVDSLARLRALVTVNWLEESPAREVLLKHCGKEEWQYDYLNGFFDSYTRPLPDQDGGRRERNLRLQCRRAARWASLDLYLETGYDAEEEEPLPPLVPELMDLDADADVDDRPMVPGACHHDNSDDDSDSDSVHDDQPEVQQAYPMEQFMARAKNHQSPDYDAIIRAWNELNKKKTASSSQPRKAKPSSLSSSSSSSSSPATKRMPQIDHGPQARTGWEKPGNATCGPWGGS
ncbi:hypothetical protein PG993_010672 [Apiospora rasikravindrae]|uniref:Uncharacterized protein n=1 Tax=Apiospora rasikravindrae TaxID=990691 RepID=A0ABR1SNA7_9PEZI